MCVRMRNNIYVPNHHSSKNILVFNSLLRRGEVLLQYHNTHRKIDKALYHASSFTLIASSKHLACQHHQHVHCLVCL